MFLRKEGKTKIVYLPVTASTAIAEGSLVAFSSGKLIAATSTTAGYLIVGVLRKTIASTDADYATDSRLVPVEVPVEMNVIFNATTASLVATDVGLYCDISNAYTVNRGASTYDIAQCVKVITAASGDFILNIGNTAAVKA